MISVGFSAEELFQSPASFLELWPAVVATQQGSKCEVAAANEDCGTDQKKKKLKHKAPPRRAGCYSGLVRAPENSSLPLAVDSRNGITCSSLSPANVMLVTTDTVGIQENRRRKLGRIFGGSHPALRSRVPGTLVLKGIAVGEVSRPCSRTQSISFG